MKMENKKLNLLFLEDNSKFRKLLDSLLEEGDVQLQPKYATCLKEGLEYMDKESFDAVILDFFLPDSRGLESMHTIHEKMPNIPVIVLTALSDAKTKDEMFRQGAKGYLVKDEIIEHLIPTIREVVSL